MSAPIITFALSAYAAKTAVKGLKEGNLAKAVIGGVAAYYGFSSLAATSTAAQAGTLGSEAGTSAANAGAQNAATQTAQNLGTQATEQAATQAATQQAGGGLINSASVTAPTAAEQYGMQQAELAKAAYSGANTITPAGGSGILSKSMAFAEKNPMLTFGAMQLGGQALAGSAEQDWQEKQLKEQRRREDEARQRRGYFAVPDTGAVRYNPRTGQFEPMGAV